MSELNAPTTRPSSPGAPLVSELAHDADMLDLVEMYVAELPTRVDAIQSALRQGDLDTLTRLSHQMKGSAGGYGFPQITDAARAVELDCKAKADLAKITDEVRALADLCARARAKA